MKERDSKLTCKCGAEMNHHADKLVDPVGREEAARMDPALGGMILEIHGCPACGIVETRRVEVKE
jgi:hypothetical protein